VTDCKEETITTRGRNVRLFRGGDGPPLLFLHDTFCPSWLLIHESLSANYEVFVPIHPGCAGSESDFEQFAEIEDMVFHYLDLCESLHLERPLVVGASFGGWIAVEWAMRYSRMLRGLVLVDALGLRVPEAPAADILSLDPAAARQVLFADPSSALALGIIPDAPKPEEVVSVLLARQTLARFAWQFPDNPRLHRYLYRVKVPTLVIWGEDDGFVPIAHGQAYHEGIAKAELVVLPDCGHLPHVEQPALCQKIVLDFLRKSESEPA
jgi:pimeloyl-ACP methyl ester carboxylesterase